MTDISQVRPIVKNLRARAIDGKSQLVFWDKPSGGHLVGYSSRIRSDDQQEPWKEVPARDIYWGNEYHAVRIPHGPTDPADVVVGIRAANVHRHSDPSPETHLAADYIVLIGFLGRDGEPRTSLAPKRPHFALVEEGDSTARENILDWATKPLEQVFHNHSLEEVRYLSGARRTRRSQRVCRAAQSADGWTRESCGLPHAANALLDRSMGQPDLTILTMTQRSSQEMHFEIEHATDDAPRWSRVLQQGEAARMEGVGDGRLFEPFGANSPGCWALATHVVAMHVSGSDRWLTGADDEIERAYVECWEGSMIGGHVYQNLQVGCYRDFRRGLVVHLESDDGEELKSWTLRAPAMSR